MNELAREPRSLYPAFQRKTEERKKRHEQREEKKSSVNILTERDRRERGVCSCLHNDSFSEKKRKVLMLHMSEGVFYSTHSCSPPTLSWGAEWHLFYFEGCSAHVFSFSFPNESVHIILREHPSKHTHTHSYSPPCCKHYCSMKASLSVCSCRLKLGCVW